MSNYPDGSDNKDSPWNKPEPKECPECDGDGEIEVEISDEEIDQKKCPNCNGFGWIEDEDEI